MADEKYTFDDAESAGWRLVHQSDEQVAVGSETQGRIVVTPASFVAEKSYSQAGASASLITEQGESIEQLTERIAARERVLGNSSAPATVTLPAADEDSEPQQITEDEFSKRLQNDVLTVLSDTNDPESEPVQKIIVGGEEQSEEVLSEPEPLSATEQGVQEEHDAALAQTEKEDGRVAGEAQGEEVTQPVPGEATNASDSEQQAQVPASEAASTDQLATNAPEADGLILEAGQTPPEEVGPDTDAQAPAAKPNEGDQASAAEKLAPAEFDAGDASASE